MTAQPSFIRWFSDVGLSDVAQVGGKNASLGELTRHLTAAGVRVPAGFAVTADAYRHFTRFLLDCGIDSVAVNADAVIATTQLIADAEAAATTVAAGAR